MTERPDNLIAWSLSACILLALWMRAHVWSRGIPSGWTWPAFAGRSALGFLTLLSFAEGVQRVIVFATQWRLWPILLAGAILVECVMALARLERNIVPKRAGRSLTVLRVSTILVVVLMLCQPVFVLDLARHLQRHIVVLLDVSASMQVPDTNLTVPEKVRLAESLKLPTAHRSCRLDRVAGQLDEAAQTLLAQVDWLNALAGTSPELRTRQLKENATAQQKTLTAILATLTDISKTLAENAKAGFLIKEAPQQAAILKTFTEALASEGIQPVEAALKQMNEWRGMRAEPGNTADSVREALRKSAAFLSGAEGQLRPVGDAADEAFYRSLSGSDRVLIDRVASLRRSEVAGLLLTARPAPLTGAGKPPLTPSLLAQWDREFGVQLYTFGTFPTEVQIASLLSSTGTVTMIPPPRNQCQGTDIAGTLGKIAPTLTPEQTAGVVLLSDGRHNAASSVDAIARKLGAQRIPVFPVVLGGTRIPPTDIAIASVTAPETVSTNDRISFAVNVKADGAAGSNVTVTLFDGTTPVASNTVTPTESTWQRPVLLSTTPTNNGMHAYRIQADLLPSEVDTNNNAVSIPVLVASDYLNVLLVEGYPRWEFRYLKNLLLQRDKNIRLQYLLLHPDQINGLTNRPPRPASVTADRQEPEATRLPADETEWMKFDVIILGDVNPEELGTAALNSVRNYVLKRGGSLVVIAGSRHMPQSYTGTPLADILPVTFKPGLQALLAAPEAEFRLGLTAEGRHEMFMRLDDNTAGNEKAWMDVPVLRWRNGSITAKDGARVLAYATAPDLEQTAMPARIPDAGTLLKQQQTERERPLLVSHQAGFGSVLMFGTDQIWRLRYKKGDLYYHKFWGQILSWATADRIATGLSPVRIGTQRSRYEAGSPVRITARLATTDFRPVTEASPSATLWSGNRIVTRIRLDYREGSPGIYTAETAPLPGCQYRIELDTAGSREAAPIEPHSVSAEFSVTDAPGSEMVDLSADRGLLANLAGLTAGKVLEPCELDSLPRRLGPARVTQSERKQLDVWNSWPWFLLILTLLTAEWVIRKKVRLP